MYRSESWLAEKAHLFLQQVGCVQKKKNNEFTFLEPAMIQKATVHYNGATMGRVFYSTHFEAYFVDETIYHSFSSKN